MEKRTQKKEILNISTLRRVLRLAKLRIIFLVVFTSIIGAFVASNNNVSVVLLTQIILVVFFSSTGAKLINNILDYKIDSMMDRTVSRKDDIDAIGKQNLWIISLALCCVSILLSILWFHIFVTILVLFAILSYVIWYTLYLKRYSPFGVIIGGLPGALPILIGGFAVSQENILEVLILFIIMMVWQPPHFWALALKLKKDYKKADIPVFSVSFGIILTKLFIYLYITALIPLNIFMGYYGNYNMLYFFISIILGLLYLIISFYALEKKKDYKLAFLSSNFYLLFFLISLLFRYI